MLECANHPGVAVDGHCGACARPLCGACLFEFMGGRYCGPCRDQLLAQMRGQSVPRPGSGGLTDRLIPTRNPKALTGYYLAIFSLIPCAGNFLGPAAVVLGFLGLRARREDPQLPGRAHALVAIILGLITSVLYWGLALLGLVGITSSR